jgi:hypothetical protein
MSSSCSIVDPGAIYERYVMPVTSGQPGFVTAFAAASMLLLPTAARRDPEAWALVLCTSVDRMDEIQKQTKKYNYRTESADYFKKLSADIRTAYTNSNYVNVTPEKIKCLFPERERLFQHPVFIDSGMNDENGWERIVRAATAAGRRQ